MSSYTKHVLVPEALLNDTLRKSEMMDSTPELDALVTLDKTMESVLEDKSMSLEEKVAAYADAIRKHRIFKGKLEIDERRMPHQPTFTQPSATAYDILERLPKSFRAPGHTLLKRLEGDKQIGLDYGGNTFTGKGGEPLPGADLTKSLGHTFSKSHTKYEPGPSHSLFKSAVNRVTPPRRAVAAKPPIVPASAGGKKRKEADTVGAATWHDALQD